MYQKDKKSIEKSKLLSQQNNLVSEQFLTIIECNSCKLSCLISQNQLIGEDQQIGVQIIKIGQGENYCEKCLEEKILEETQTVRTLEERFIYFKQFESSFDRKDILQSLDISQSQENPRESILPGLRSEQNALIENYNKLKQDSNLLKDKIYSLEVDEQKFWDGINKFEKRINKVEEKSLNTKLAKIIESEELEQLGKISVIHMFLDIKIDDNLAYIQNIQIGKKLDSVQLSFEDIAVGLGHFLMGLNIIALKYAYDYKKIQSIKLKGFQTEITLKGKKKIFSLLCTRETQKLFGELMQAFLAQLFHLSNHILRVENIQYSEEFRLPFGINIYECKIAQLYIDPCRMDQRTKWNLWTKAMRYFLIDFKHLVTIYAINDRYL